LIGLKRLKRYTTRIINALQELVDARRASRPPSRTWGSSCLRCAIGRAPPVSTACECEPAIPSSSPWLQIDSDQCRWRLALAPRRMRTRVASLLDTRPSRQRIIRGRVQNPGGRPTRPNDCDRGTARQDSHAPPRSTETRAATTASAELASDQNPRTPAHCLRSVVRSTAAP
jgi:hypothetical protein